MFLFSLAFFFFLFNLQDYQEQNVNEKKVVEIACFVKYRKKYTICDLAQFSISHLWSKRRSSQRLNPL